jgi:hypothetical protein
MVTRVIGSSGILYAKRTTSGGRSGSRSERKRLQVVPSEVQQLECRLGEGRFSAPHLDVDHFGTPNQVNTLWARGSDCLCRGLLSQGRPHVARDLILEGSFPYEETLEKGPSAPSTRPVPPKRLSELSERNQPISRAVQCGISVGADSTCQYPRWVRLHVQPCDQ